jgi:hypothetical protein
VAAAVGACFVVARRERFAVGDVEWVARNLAELARPATADSPRATSRSPMITRAMPRAAPVIAIVLPAMWSTRTNFTREKFRLEGAQDGNPGGMTTGRELQLEFVMSYVVRTSNPLGTWKLAIQRDRRVPLAQELV